MERSQVQVPFGASRLPKVPETNSVDTTDMDALAGE
jgi:hypothetical protein